jgi:hypothetical protein
MSANNSVPVRAFLIHMSHYDPLWYSRKAQEQPFNLKIGLEVVDALAAVGMNMLAIDLDDGVEFKSHPELKRHYTVPMSHLEELVGHARSIGLEIVPKLNFSKGSQRHNDWFSPHHELPDNDEYYRLAFEVIDEVIDVCKPERYFFIGMDEDMQRSDAQYISVIKRLHSELTQRKLKTIMWNDSVHLSGAMIQCVRKTLAAEDAIARDVVQVVWDYGPTRRYALDRIQDMRKKGFETWIAPGTNPEHVRAWRQTVAAKDCAGLMMTMWQSVCDKTREAMLERIRTLGPICSGPVPAGEIPLTETRNISTAPPHPRHLSHKGRGEQGALGEIVAPNRLKQTHAQTPYFFPPNVYLRNWMVLGPYTFKGSTDRKEIFRESIDSRFLSIDEAELTAKPEGTSEQGATWRRWVPPSCEDPVNIVDLAKMYGGVEFAAAYLVAQIHSESDVSDARLCFGADDYIKVWLNGVHIHTNNKECRAVVQDHDIVNGVTLDKGWNTLLVKCINVRGTWGMMARVAAADGRPIETE